METNLKNLALLSENQLGGSSRPISENVFINKLAFYTHHDPKYR